MFAKEEDEGKGRHTTPGPLLLKLLDVQNSPCQNFQRNFQSNPKQLQRDKAVLVPKIAVPVP